MVVFAAGLDNIRRLNRPSAGKSPASDRRVSLAKSLFIKTYGCQMNEYDSARMADVMVPLGYRQVGRIGDADLIILNTCHIREKAAEKVFSELGRIREVKVAGQLTGRRVLIAVAGCVAQAEGNEIIRRAPYVDLLIGPQTYHRLPEMVIRALSLPHGGTIADTEFPLEVKFDRLPEESAPRGVAAYLTVQEGCDKFCTFCVVPYTRGAEYSRPAADVESEARRLVRAGAMEITLLGQNVNAYRTAVPGDRDMTLGRLIRRLAAIEGLERLRYTTSHPRDMNDDLIEAHAEEPKLMPFLHLPAQSGSDRILAAMNRRHGAADYLSVVERLRAARPDIALSSDFIVGYPGETEADFEHTLALVREVGYAQAFSFKYSARPGTPAAESNESVPEEVKDERLARLQALLADQRTDFNNATVDRELDVLFERPGRLPGQLSGRSPYLQGVHVEGPPAYIGKVGRVRIEAATPGSLSGRLRHPSVSAGGRGELGLASPAA